MKTKFIVCLVTLFAALCLASESRAAIQRVVVIQTENLEAYVKELQHGQELLKKMGSVQVLRVWRTRFAGTQAGTVMVCVEYPDLAAYAADEKKVAAHAEFQAWLKRLAQQRKVISDSLYDEMTLQAGT